MSRRARAPRAAGAGGGTEFHIDKIDMVANTGTDLDSPFHRYAEGKDLAALPLTSLADLVCVVPRVPPGLARAIDRLPLTAADVRGSAVLVHTGWDRHWGTDRYFDGHPHLTGDLAKWLVDAGAALVGIDSLNIDGTETGEWTCALDATGPRHSDRRAPVRTRRRPRAWRSLFCRPGEGEGVRHRSRAGIRAGVAASRPDLPKRGSAARRGAGWRWRP